MAKKQRKYQPITAEELKGMLGEAKQQYLEFCQKNAEYIMSLEDGHKGDSAKSHLREESLGHLRIATGIFDEAMRRVARDYTPEKFQMLDHYYRYVRIEEAWGTRLWMDVLYNLMGFPKTFWLMRHFNWLL